MRFLRCMKYEFKSMAAQPEFLAVLVLGCLFSLLGFYSEDYGDYGGFRFVMVCFSPLSPAPEYGSLLYSNVFGRMLYQFMCPIMASIPAACSYYREKKNHMDALLIPAFGRGNYIGAKLLTAFLVGFAVSTLPFVLNMYFTEIIFPRNEMVTAVDPAFYDGMAQLAGKWNVFGDLMFSQPLINHSLHIALVGLWSAGAALLSLGISFFFRRHYFINLLIGPVILLFAGMILSAAGGGAFDPREAFPLLPEKLVSSVSNLKYNVDKLGYNSVVYPLGWGIAAVYAMLYAACGALTAAHLIKHRDVV